MTVSAAAAPASRRRSSGEVLQVGVGDPVTSLLCRFIGPHGTAFSTLFDRKEAVAPEDIRRQHSSSTIGHGDDGDDEPTLLREELAAESSLEVGDVLGGRRGAFVPQREAFRIRGAHPRVTGLAVDCAAGCVFSAGSDRVVKKWSLGGGALLGEVETQHADGVMRLELSCDGAKLFATGEDQATTVICTAGPMAVLRVLRSASAPIVGLAVSEDATRVASCSLEQTLRVYDAETAAEVASVAVPEALLCAQFFGNTLLAGTAGGSLLAVDLSARAGGSAAAAVRKFGEHPPYIFSLLAEELDGETFVYSTDGEGVAITELSTGRRHGLLAVGEKSHTDSIFCTALMPGVGLLCTGSQDRTVKVWCIETGSCLATLEGHTKQVNAICATDSGSVISGSHDGDIIVWED